MIKINIWIVYLIGVSQLFGQSFPPISFQDHFERNKTKHEMAKFALGLSPHSQNSIGSVDSDTQAQTSLLQELGYIAAMQVAFGGLSYLASRKKGIGPIAASGFDIFMGVAGLLNVANQESVLVKAGYIALSTGFFAKSYYTMQASDDHSEKTVFRVNYIGLNVLVYSGYYLDTL